MLKLFPWLLDVVHFVTGTFGMGKRKISVFIYFLIAGYVEKKPCVNIYSCLSIYTRDNMIASYKETDSSTYYLP